MNATTADVRRYVDVDGAKGLVHLLDARTWCFQHVHPDGWTSPAVREAQALKAALLAEGDKSVPSMLWLMVAPWTGKVTV